MSEDKEMKGLIELGWFGELPPEQKPARKVERTDKQRLIELIQLCKDLRDEVARLRANLINCAARLEAYYGEDYPAVRDAKNALDGGKGVQGG